MNNDNFKNNENRDKLYHVWKGMRGRCLSKTNKDYPNYGGRGIDICDEWMSSFQSFFFWAINSGYDKGLTIDRINNDYGYYPDNCRWATVAEQNKNRRNAINVSFGNGDFSVTDLSKITGLKPATIYGRIKKRDKDILRPIEDLHESLIGKRFGKLTVVKFSHTAPDSYWLCKCDCGSYKVINGSRMIKGYTKSCGCIRRLPFSSVIVQKNISGETINTFPNVEVASKETGIERRYIVSCAKGRSKTARGYIFKAEIK